MVVERRHHGRMKKWTWDCTRMIVVIVQTANQSRVRLTKFCARVTARASTIGLFRQSRSMLKVTFEVQRRSMAISTRQWPYLDVIPFGIHGQREGGWALNRPIDGRSAFAGLTILSTMRLENLVSRRNTTSICGSCLESLPGSRPSFSEAFAPCNVLLCLYGCG